MDWKWLEGIKGVRRAVILAFMLLVTLFVSGATVDALKNELLPWLYQTSLPQASTQPGQWTQSIVAGIGSVVLILLFLILARLRRAWFTASARLVPERGETARKVVIMGLSQVDELDALLHSMQGADTTGPISLTNLRQARERSDAESAPQTKAGPLDKIESLIKMRLDQASLNIAAMLKSKYLSVENGKLEATPDYPGADHRWVQNLRALRPHILGDSALRMVVIVPSDKTLDQAYIFRDMLLELFDGILEPGICVEVLDGPAPDYDDFLSVQNALNRAISVAIRTMKRLGNPVGSKDICIDATSGKATFSIGAALVTLNHDLLYSYVTTSELKPVPGGGDIRFYDAHVDLAAFVDD